MAFVFGTIDSNDTLVGTLRNDFIFGESGDDILRGLDGDDRLEGGLGNDRLFGGNGRDTLLGADGDDRLEGGNGNDYLEGGFGSDRVFGGNGNDTITTNSSVHFDTIDGGRGIDTLLLSGRDDFDLRATTHVEQVGQIRGNADILADEDFFLSADSDIVVIDMGDGVDDGVAVAYDSDRLDFEFIGGKIRFGEPGDLDKTLVLENVEHLTLLDSDNPTGNHVFDHWIT